MDKNILSAKKNHGKMAVLPVRSVASWRKLDSYN